MNRRQTKIDVLREARRYLIEGETTWICNALNAAGRLNENTFEIQASNSIIASLERSLNGWSSVELWLNDEHGVPFEDLTLERMLEYCLRWIDEMITNLIKKGTL